MVPDQPVSLWNKVSGEVFAFAASATGVGLAFGALYAESMYALGHGVKAMSDCDRAIAISSFMAVLPLAYTAVKTFKYVRHEIRASDETVQRPSAVGPAGQQVVKAVSQP